MTDIHVDPEVLREAAPKFSHVAREVTNAKQELWAAGEGEGSPWGGDPTGQAFEKGYLPAVQKAGELFRQLAESLEDTRGKLDTAADRYQAQEDHVTSGMDRIGDQVDGIATDRIAGGGH